jgi:hypothetical protein
MWIELLGLFSVAYVIRRLLRFREIARGIGYAPVSLDGRCFFIDSATLKRYVAISSGIERCLVPAWLAG